MARVSRGYMCVCYVRMLSVYYLHLTDMLGRETKNKYESWGNIKISRIMNAFIE